MIGFDYPVTLAGTRRGERGFAALVSVMLTAIILTVIVSTIMTIATSNRRFNNSDHLSRQALLAAESGADELQSLIEEKIAANVPFTSIATQVSADTCDIAPEIVADYSPHVPATSTEILFAGANSGTAFGCQTVSFSALSSQFTIASMGTRVLRLPENTSRVRLTWANDSTGSNGPRNNNTNPPTNSWGGNTSAGIIMQVVGLGNSVSEVNENSIFLRPRQTGGSAPITDNMMQADCTGGVGCTADIDITAITGRQRASVKLTALYRSAFISSFEALDAAGNVLPQTDVMVISSSGRAGSAMRRIERQVTIGNADGLDSLPVEAIYAGGDVCKVFRYFELGATLGDPLNCN